MIADKEYDNPELFAALKKKPFIAWPTVMLILMSLSMISFSWYMVLSEKMPLWVGFIINVVAYYYLFSPVHDGAHRSISKHEKINDFFNGLAYLPIFLVATDISYPRMFHMQHHIHTGKKDLDPDLEISSKGRNALGPWFFWGSQYKGYFKKYGHKLPRLKKGKYQNARLILSVVIGLSILITHPLESIFLWIVPSSFGLTWMTAFVFSYLPHHIHKRREGVDPLDPYQSTCNIVGFERLLSPLMQYQNYHLVHHLYPTVPFYRYEKIWKANYSEHMKHDPATISIGDSRVALANGQ